MRFVCAGRVGPLASSLAVDIPAGNRHPHGGRSEHARISLEFDIFFVLKCLFGMPVLPCMSTHVRASCWRFLFTMYVAWLNLTRVLRSCCPGSTAGCNQTS